MVIKIKFINSPIFLILAMGDYYFQIGGYKSIDVLLGRILDRKSIEKRLDEIEFISKNYKTNKFLSEFIFSLKGKKFANEIEFLDYILLFRYIIGEKPVIKKAIMEQVTVQSQDDYELLYRANANLKEEESGKWLNPELHYAYARVGNRHSDYNRHNWTENITKIFNNEAVVTYFKEKSKYDKQKQKKP